MPRSLHAVFPRLSLSALVPLLVCWGLLLVCAAASAQTPPSSIVPTDRLQEAWWAQRHAQVLEQVKQHADTPLLLIGDSIT
ncbi:acetylhydrolase, partial [Xanthomonas arboricola pv. corylina]